MYDISPSNNPRDRLAHKGLMELVLRYNYRLCDVYIPPLDNSREELSSQGVNEMPPPYRNIDILSNSSHVNNGLSHHATPPSKVTEVVNTPSHPNNATYDIPRSNSHSSTRTQRVNIDGRTDSISSVSNGLYDMPKARK